MTKRNQTQIRRPRDFYPTPEKGVLPLLQHLPNMASFAEPCSGGGDLIHHLIKHDHWCNWASDLQPSPDYKLDDEVAVTMDALDLTSEHVKYCDYIITNPPWDRKVLHPMIDHFRKLRPTWLLLDADWAHTKQARSFLLYCEKIVSVGRLKWIPDSPHSGLDNCAWYLFQDYETKTEFINR